MELENKVPEQLDSIKSDNLKALQKLFPSVIKDGQLDLEALKEEIGNFEEVKEEKYDFTWAGKQEAKKKAQETIVVRTLNLIEKDSVNPDNTENLYIEGDNLEVLKLLRQNYRGAIKMIYIDPPYNTGNDFVYKDNFKISQEESDKKQGYTDENSQKLQKNLKDNNRFHANWLSMIYPRLKIARDLLSPNGAIFIHIDENEVCNLQNLCYEIFGEENVIGTIIWDKRNPKGETFDIAYQHESILVFCKNKEELSKENFYKNKENAEKMFYIVDKLKKKYGVVTNEMREEFKEWINKNNDILSGGEKAYNLLDDEGNIYQSVSMAAPDKPEKRSYRPLIHPLTKKECPVPKKGWRFIDETMDLLLENSRIVFGKDETIQPRQKYFLRENMEESVSSLLYYGGNDEVLGGIFENPKPVNVSKKIISTLCKGSEDVILDFFSGSGTTAEAVMQLNAEDGGNRKFIMVQIDEEVNEKSEAYKFLNEINKPTNISEIGKERIRRAGEKIKKEIEENNKKVKDGEELKKVPDIGFKVFRTADTNINWRNIRNISNYTDLPFNEPDRLDFIENYNDKDVVYEVLLHQRDLPLSEKLELLSAIGDRTYLYASSYLVCLETNITETLIKELANLNPLPVKFIFRDSAFKSDVNLKESTFRYLKTLVEKNSGMNKRTYTIEFI